MELSLTDVCAPPPQNTAPSMPEDGGLEPGPSPFRRTLSSLRPAEPEPGEAGAEAAAMLLGLMRPESLPATQDGPAMVPADALPGAAQAANGGNTALEPALGLLGLGEPGPEPQASRDLMALQPSWWRHTPSREQAAGTTARIELPATLLAASAPSASLASASPVGQFASFEAAGMPVMAETVGTSEWGEALAARLSVMASQGEQQATLRLTPEELGPLEIRMSVGEERVSVVFSAQQGETRSALQDSLPRLRELFAQAGLPTLDAGVSQQAPRQPRSSAALPRGTAGAEPVAPALPAVREHALRLGNRLLDTWA